MSGSLHFLTRTGGSAGGWEFLRRAAPAEIDAVARQLEKIAGR